MGATFKVGEKVEVIRTSYSGGPRVGVITEVRANRNTPDKFCGDDEVLLEGSNIYQKVSDLRLVTTGDSLDALMKAVENARANGYTVKVEVVL